MDGTIRAHDTRPHLILFNGKVITADWPFTIAQAVAIAGNRILAVGTDAAIAELAGPHTRAIDLGGKTVMPELTPNHPKPR